MLGINYPSSTNAITLQETFKHIFICRVFMTVTEPCNVCWSHFCKRILNNYDGDKGKGSATLPSDIITHNSLIANQT